MDGSPVATGGGTRQRGVVAALGVSQIFAWGSSYYLPAVIARPVAADTGWSLGWVIGGLSLGLLVSGLVSIKVGQLIDRNGGRLVLASSAGLLAAGLALMAAAPNLAIYLAAWIVLGLGMGAGLYDAAFATLGRLFGKDARRAITTLTLWGGFASTICWPLSAFLVEALGWRGACLVYAGINLAVAVPLYVFVVPRVPRLVATPSPPVRTAGGGAFGTRRLLTLLLLGGLVTLCGAISATWSVHIITMLQAGGKTLAEAVALGALVGPAQVAARVVEMAGGGRHHPLWTMTASAVLILTGVALLWLDLPLAAAALVAYGAGNGIWSIARGTLPLALFGPDGYARLMGRLATPSLIAQALAPFGAAFVIQTAGAHALAGILVAAAAAVVIGVGGLWALSHR